MQRRLDAADKRIGKLESRIVELEAERDHFKELYFQALADSRAKDKRIAELEEKLASAEKQLAWFRKQYFGDKSEAGLFDDPTGDEQPETDKPKEPRKRGQQKGSKGHGRTKRDNLPSEDEDITLPPSESCCPDCQKPFSELPETDDSTITEIETIIYNRRVRRKRYAPRCTCARAKIVTAPAPPKLYPKTTIGTSLWVHICVQKFLHSTPTNRILKDLALRGLGLAAGTVTGGMAFINVLIEPLYEAIKNFCRGERYWNADETSWRVFEDAAGLRKKKKWWLWVIAGEYAVVYILDKSRSAEVPEDFFAGSNGTLMTDRFKSYRTLPKSIRKAWCWVHVRRDFLKIYDGVPKLKRWARQWLLDMGRLFALNHRRFNLFTERQFGPAWAAANKELLEHVQLLESNWAAQLQTHLEKEQRKVLISLKRHWDGLTLFLADPRIPLDNNRAERLLRYCVVYRKNSYGNGIEWAGHLHAKFFSIIQTWLINGLDPQALLLDYFELCSKTPGIPPPNIDKFLPWKMEEDRRQDFRLPDSYKRPS
jgi:transposase